jgi:putative thioredoxin
MPAHVIDVSLENFEPEVLAASFNQPVIVDFWAPWCGPCRTLTPLLEKLADEYQGRFRLAKINADENQEIATQLQVRTIPSIKAFVQGRVVDQFDGALPEGQLRSFIDSLMPSPADAYRAEAAELFHTGDAKGALAKLVEGSRVDPNNEGIRLDAVEVLLQLGNADEAKQLLDAVPSYEQENERAQSLRARLALSGTQVDFAALEARIATNPKDHAARIELAKGLAAGQRYPEAFEQLLESIYRDKNLNEGEARKTMLQFFEMLAPDPTADDLIRHYRRQLATALN